VEGVLGRSCRDLHVAGALASPCTMLRACGAEAKPRRQEVGRVVRGLRGSRVNSLARPRERHQAIERPPAPAFKNGAKVCLPGLRRHGPASAPLVICAIDSGRKVLARDRGEGPLRGAPLPRRHACGAARAASSKRRRLAQARGVSREIARNPTCVTSRGRGPESCGVPPLRPAARRAPRPSSSPSTCARTRLRHGQSR
jgi:hypothetical protein